MSPKIAATLGIALLTLACAAVAAEEAANPAGTSPIMQGMHEKAPAMRNRMEQMSPEQRQAMRGQTRERMKQMRATRSGAPRPYGTVSTSPFPE